MNASERVQHVAMLVGIALMCTIIGIKATQVDWPAVGAAISSLLGGAR